MYFIFHKVLLNIFSFRDNLEKCCMARQADAEKNAVCLPDTKAGIQKLSHKVECVILAAV